MKKKYDSVIQHELDTILFGIVNPTFAQRSLKNIAMLAIDTKFYLKYIPHLRMINTKEWFSIPIDLRRKGDIDHANDFEQTGKRTTAILVDQLENLTNQFGIELNDEMMYLFPDDNGKQMSAEYIFHAVPDLVRQLAPGIYYQYLESISKQLVKLQMSKKLKH
jgi:hypothetical protein